MKPIRNRSELLALLAQRAPTKACERAISENRATILGGFNPAKGLSGWAVRVEAKHGQTWLFLVECDEDARRYCVRQTDDLPPLTQLTGARWQ